MYLKDLMLGEKFAFYSIAKHLVNIDGDYSEQEKFLLNGFLSEMDLSESQIQEIELSDAVEMLTFSSHAVRKEIFIELIGVTLCDEFFHTDEAKFLDDVAETFHISHEEKNELIQLVNELLVIYKRMQAIVDQGSDN